MCIGMDDDREIDGSAAGVYPNGSTDIMEEERGKRTAESRHLSDTENAAAEEAGQPVYEQVQADDLRLEDVLTQVEHCLMQLENPQISLEDSFRYYEEGVRKLKLCNEKVAQIEQKMLMINGQGELEDF